MQVSESRRGAMKYLSSGLLGAGVAACGGSQAENTSKPAFVLVHGAWHNSSTYTEVIAFLAQLGHAAVAVDLPGHGLRARLPRSWRQRPFNAPAFAMEPSPVANVTLNDYANHVVEAIDRMRGLGNEKVVLVGHSLGGATITQVGEIASGKLSKLVYLTAFLPFNGKTLLETSLAPEGALNEVPGLMIGDAVATGANRIDPDSPDPVYQAKLKSAFYADVAEDVSVAMGNLLTPDEPVAPAVTPITRSASKWGAVPRHYIKCLQDRAVVPALAQKMIDTADAEFPQHKTIVHSMNTSHSPFLSQPEALARLLATIAMS
ncbi:pimeloyl-ACP methyl ester carboxylesterase [Acidovorax sp. 100]|uniref:alpha/beta fold hydrolase n=1 Tax=Acidovorax sp. 100 TaxID=2135635 RepID=UPI000F109FAA|nr:alpha/beta fold hydrolase [Acidovorax sp. 100]RMA59939.1 pimeloyl-ACP methyl ester carboxylesterase [Acidovorax sp. 100]